MQINKEKVNERLSGVPDSNRSHIYDASIVLEFLAATFMPTKFFLPANFSPTPGAQLGAKSMRKVSEGKEMLMRDLYDLYLLFREEKDYTSKVESRYIFGIIVRNLRYYKNRWEFVTWRVGTAQIWHIGPLVMRKDVSAEDRARFAAKLEDAGPQGKEVEADPVADPEGEDIEDVQGDTIAAEILNNGTSVQYAKDGGGALGPNGETHFIGVPGQAGEPKEKIVAFFDGGGPATVLTNTGRFIEAGRDIQPDVHSEPEPLEDY